MSGADVSSILETGCIHNAQYTYITMATRTEIGGHPCNLPNKQIDTKIRLI